MAGEPRKKRGLRELGIWLAIGILVAAVGSRLWRGYRIDRCLDGGGCWNHDEKRCESDQRRCPPPRP